MALTDQQSKIFNNAITGAEPGSSTWLNMLKQMQQGIQDGSFTQDDLAPFIQQINDKGHNVDLTNGTSSPIQPGSGATNKGATFTPPAPKELIPGTTIDTFSDRGQIETEAAREKGQLLDVNQQAADLRSKGLGSLADILLRQNQAQFNYDLPGIKEDLANSGLFSSPSALQAAVTRESGMLGANTAAQLGQAGVQNINAQAEGLLGATNNTVGMQQGGLQRQFSVADYNKQAQLAREIGAMQVPNAPSPFSSALYGGLSGAASAGPLWAANPGLAAGITSAGALAGATRGGGTYICTALKKAGILTQEEVDKIHDHLFPVFGKRISDVIAYGVCGPLLVNEALKKGIDWKKWKDFFFGRVINEPDQEKAFDLYIDSFHTMWKEVF